MLAQGKSALRAHTEAAQETYGADPQLVRDGIIVAQTAKQLRACHQRITCLPVEAGSGRVLTHVPDVLGDQTLLPDFQQTCGARPDALVWDVLSHMAQLELQVQIGRMFVQKTHALIVQIGAALYFLGSLVAAVSPVLWGIYAGFLIYGLGIGWGGEMVIVVGMFMGFAMGAGCAGIPEGGWRLMVALAALFALVVEVGIQFIPNSPRWLVLRSLQLQDATVLQAGESPLAIEARQALAFFRGESEEAVEQEFSTMLNDAREASAGAGSSANCTDTLRYPRPLVIGCGLVFLQQVTGQPSVLYFATNIFKSAGFAGAGPQTRLMLMMLVSGGGWLLTLFDWEGPQTRLMLMMLVSGGGWLLTLFDWEGPQTRLMLMMLVSGGGWLLTLFDWEGPQTRLMLMMLVSGGGWLLTLFDWEGPQTRLMLMMLVSGFVKLLATLFTVWRVDLYGRRQLLMWGIATTSRGSGVRVFTIKLEDLEKLPVSQENVPMAKCPQEKVSVPRPWAITTVVALMIYVSGYQVGFGPISWLMISEIFPLGVRGSALSTAAMVNFGSNILMTLCQTALMNALTPSGTFFGYLALAILSFVFVAGVVPETKGKTLEELFCWDYEALTPSGTFFGYLALAILSFVFVAGVVPMLHSEEEVTECLVGCVGPPPPTPLQYVAGISHRVSQSGSAATGLTSCRIVTLVPPYWRDLKRITVTIRGMNPGEALQPHVLHVQDDAPSSAEALDAPAGPACPEGFPMLELEQHHNLHHQIAGPYMQTPVTEKRPHGDQRLRQHSFHSRALCRGVLFPDSLVAWAGLPGAPKASTRSAFCAVSAFFWLASHRLETVIFGRGGQTRQK
ncbi:Solute carrier family 2, facilitated glucose transporter member 12 [Symbiodinium microadriaticum]|uniref:Hexose transporter 1 n=1 Tax=Symbiodinium microadriaticum TaxID=2951 RepID=A0A1Q9F323_SYMMI|nr:Solute carrier family 2, facilitated glucose transporter member 12 [Symbiodinium microadriaticum]